MASFDTVPGVTLSHQDDFDGNAESLVEDLEDTRTGVADDEIEAFVARAQSRNLESVTALSAFQRRMSRYPQLTPDAQAELVADYQRGVFSKEALEIGGLGRTDERKCRERVSRGEYAIEHLIGSSFKLVWLIVRELTEERYGRDRATDMLPDIMNEANVAVVEACKDFDPARCPTFHTYLARVVRDRVRMVLTKEGPIRLSPSWSRLKRIASVRIPALTTELGRTPSKEEIQADLLERCLEWAESKLTEDQLHLNEAEQRDVMMAKLRKQGMLGAIRDIDDVLIASQTVASLDTPVGEEGGTTMGEMLPGQRADETFDSVELSEVRGALNDALSTLPDREREIILYRFAFVDGESWTYAKIAERYGVTAERIRQIEKNVLAKLSSAHGQYSMLSGFLPSQFDTPEPDEAPRRRFRR